MSLTLPITNSILLLMKKYLLSLSLLAIYVMSHAQTGFHVDDLTLEFPNPDPSEIEQILATHVKNTSNTTTTYRWIRETICTDPGYGNSICIGISCYEQTTGTNTFQLAPGDSTEMSIHLWKNDVGMPNSEVHVEIYPENQPGNSVTTKAYFGQCTTATTEPGDFANLTIYPNPAADFLLVENATGATFVRIYDVAGALVLNHDLLRGYRIDLTQLSAGIYTARVSNAIETKSSVRIISKQ